MRSGDADEVASFAGSGFAKRLGPTNHGDASVPCTLELGVVFRHCGGDNERSRPINMAGIVSFNDLDADATQILNADRMRVASGNLHAAARKELREGAHSGAGNSDEVDRPRI